MKRPIAFAIAVVFFLASCAQTTPRLVRSDVSIGSDRTVLLLPIDVIISEQTLSGRMEPRASWMQTATKLMEQALRKRLSEKNLRLVKYIPPTDPKAEEQIQQLIKVHSAVRMAIYNHEHIAELKLPAKKEFDWDLGDKMSLLKKSYNSDYVLLINFQSFYASGARQAYAILVALVAGVVIITAQQQAHAALVNLKTGEVTWYNDLYMEFGDVRERDGAEAAIDYILESFPK